MPISTAVPSSLPPKTAARTALPQPANTSQNVPMNSATPRFHSSMGSPSWHPCPPNCYFVLRGLHTLHPGKSGLRLSWRLGDHRQRRRHADNDIVADLVFREIDIRADVHLVDDVVGEFDLSYVIGRIDGLHATDLLGLLGDQHLRRCALVGRRVEILTREAGVRALALHKNGH